jgi:hemerythrin-like domain-containing protein
MNTATQNLENDHVYILRLTDIMLKMVEKESNEIVDFELVVKLIRNFADRFHHTKEEDLLFPLMGEKGFSSEQGPVAVMLHEHVQGRNFTTGMSDGIEKLKGGDRKALLTIYENMSGYAYLLQGHISKENNILFRMADQVLSNEEQKILLIQFSKVENNADQEFNRESSIAKIDQLASKYQ